MGQYHAPEHKWVTVSHMQGCAADGLHICRVMQSSKIRKQTLLPVCQNLDQCVSVSEHATHILAANLKF